MKPLLILKSDLTGHYYATRSYKIIDADKGLYDVGSGKCEDVTEQIERIIHKAIKKAA